MPSASHKAAVISVFTGNFSPGALVWIIARARRQNFRALMQQSLGLSLPQRRSKDLQKQTLLLCSVVAVAMAQYAAPYGKPDEIKYPPQPYQFGYDSNDEYGNTAYRKESGDGNGAVQGSYGYKDAQGIERTVEYVADENGFRAQVKTNEPGTENKSPANIDLYANPIAINYVPQPQRYQAAPAAAPVYKPQY